MWFGVLGRLEVRRSDGVFVPISGPARRQLLAALLCRAGSLVTASALIDDLWGVAAPRTALNTLRTHVARLRDGLGRDDEADTVVRTEGDGYRLVIGGDDLDAATFERLIVESSTLADPVAAIRSYDRALALWRDDAYVEFGDAPFAVGERIRLAELRALARERRTDLALTTGTPADLIGDLEQRVRTEPYRERGWEQLAVALYRAGRQADALGACQRARQLLVDDLGVDPGPGLRNVEEQLLRQDPELPTAEPHQVIRAPQLDRCPYLGLAGYEEHDAALFVGRERLTSVLAGRLADQSVVVGTGASGVGKSSLVRAGLVPALRSGALPGSAAWRIDVRVPADGIPAKDGARPDLLVLDQAEELFTTSDAEVRDALVGDLVDYVENSDGRVVLVLRGDFYARLADVDAFAPFAEKTAVLVGPMRADELRRALVEPAADAGLRLEPDLIEAIMDDVAGQPEPLPLLSEAMVRTWEHRNRDVLTLEGYRLAGELGGALEIAAEECYVRLDDAGRRAARHLLVRMATRTATGWARRPIAWLGSESDAERQALTALIAARLVVASDERVEITHDAVFAHWPRLRDWLAERNLAAHLLQHLDQAATAWLSSGRQDADLYRGPRLTAALDWRADHPEDVSLVEEQFLDASGRAAEAELEAARAQTAREARGRRTLRRVAVGLAAMVVLALAGGGVAVLERGTARTEAQRAEQGALAADARRLAALSVSAPDIATSSLLAAAGYRLQDSPDTRSALLAAVERNQSALWRIPTLHRPQRVLATPDGSRLATIDNRRDVRVFDASTRRQIAGFYAAGYQIEAMTADDRSVVIFGPANNEANDIGRLSVVDVRTGQRIRVLTTAGDRSGTEPVMTTDARWLVTTTDERRRGGVVVDIFDATNWSAPPRQFVEPGTPVTLAAGRASFGIERADGSVDIRALPSMRTTARLGAVRGAALQPGGPLALSPDGTRVARVDPIDPRSVAVYRTAASHRARIALPTQEEDVSGLSFSPGGADLAVATLGGAVAIYRSVDGTQAEALAGHAGPVLGVTWTGVTTPKGLYTVGLDNQLVSWSVAALPRAVTESGSDVRSADRGETFGHFVLGLRPQQGSVPESHESGYVVDLDTGRSSAWPLGLADGEYVNQAVASFDGRRALVSVETQAGRNRIEIWDLIRHVRVGQLVLPAGTAKFAVGLNAAISPDGAKAYSSLGATRVGVFDLPSGRYRRSFTVRFAEPDSARIYAVPWMFDPHGRLLVGGYDPVPTSGATPPSSGSVDSRPPNQRLGVLDVSTLRLVAQTGLGDVNFPTAAAWSHDGTRLAVGTYEGTLTLYDAATLSPEASAGAVEPGVVKSASFAPDGRTIVTAGTSGDVSFYTVPDLRRMGAPLTIGNGANNGGAFAWYGERGQVEGYAPDAAQPTADLQRWFVFHSDPGSLLLSACRLAGSDITRSQWQRYVADRPYQHVCPASH